ncbi:hypothetical protein MTO96_044239 [Rhipicephalus appendiculatus]
MRASHSKGGCTDARAGELAARHRVTRRQRQLEAGALGMPLVTATHSPLLSGGRYRRASVTVGGHRNEIKGWDVRVPSRALSANKNSWEQPGITDYYTRSPRAV